MPETETTSHSISVKWLGRLAYAESWELQKRLVEERKAGQIPDTLLLVEHPHVYTLGRGADETHVLADSQQLEEIGAELFRIDRGGDVTYHGPGQLVGYPIIDLREREGDRRADVRLYVRDIEETIIRFAASYGVSTVRVAGLPGVWVGEEKLAAIGVRVSRWVTSHGFAINLNTDLAYFRQIVPCGLHDKSVTSLATLLGQKIDTEPARERLVESFLVSFGAQPINYPE